jgi:hypothetical protein
VTTDLTAPLAALAAGIVASLHCAGMCAPLSCALFRTCSGQKMISYHLARAASYSALGALLGQAGGAIAPIFSSRPSQVVPLALAAIFLAMAFGFDRNLPQPVFLRRLMALLHVRSAERSTGAALLGFVTPLIPCGPLYLMLGVSLVTGSALRGGSMMLCFALGTMPVYLLAQWQWFHLCARLSPGMLRNTQKVLACASAGLVAWRALANGGLGLAYPVCH